MKDVGRIEGGLYLLLRQLNIETVNSRKSALLVTQLSPSAKKSDIEIWHNRLGHVSPAVLARIFSINKQNMSNLSQFLVCPYAKQSRGSFPTTSIRSNSCFDLLHVVDVWGSL